LGEQRINWKDYTSLLGENYYKEEAKKAQELIEKTIKEGKSSIPKNVLQ